MPEMLVIEDLRAGYGEAVVLPQLSLTLEQGRGPRAARPQRHRQDHADQLDRRRDAALLGTHRARRQGHHAAARRPARARRHRLGAAGAQHLCVAHGGGEHDRGGAARDRGRSTRSTRCFRGWPSGAGISATSSPAASSRCWRSAARSRSIRNCCCSTSRWKGLRPIIVEELIAALKSIVRERGHLRHRRRAEPEEGAVACRPRRHAGARRDRPRSGERRTARRSGGAGPLSRRVGSRSEQSALARASE